jgi:nucleoside-diphosphate-sugar epimerase
VASLAAAGHAVRVIVRPESTRAVPTEAEAIRVPFVAERLAEAFDGVEIVAHLAGCVRARDAREFTRANVDCTRAVARAASTAGARLVAVSSLAAAGPASPSSPRREADPPAPLTAYGTSKLAAEEAVAGTDRLHWTILRPGVVYGPQDAALFSLFKMAERGILPLVGRSTAAYTFIHVDDMVRAIEAAIERPADRRVIFVGHPAPVTTRLLLEQIRAAVGRSAVIVPVPLAVTRAAAALCDMTSQLTGRLLPLDRWRYEELAAEGFVCRVDLMRELLQVEAKVNLPEGLARTARWYREQGWLRPSA